MDDDGVRCVEAARESSGSDMKEKRIARQRKTLIEFHSAHLAT